MPVEEVTPAMRRRPDVHAGRIGVIGVSLGGEVAIHAGARRPGWHATVLEGVQGGSPAEMRASDPALVTTELSPKTHFLER
jgi:dienelactone hydrolase